MRFAVLFGRFWWDFIVGEDWRIAAGVTAVLSVGALLAGATDLDEGVLTVGVGATLVLLVVASIVAPARRLRRH